MFCISVFRHFHCPRPATWKSQLFLIHPNCDIDIGWISFWDQNLTYLDASLQCSTQFQKLFASHSCLNLLHKRSAHSTMLGSWISNNHNVTLLFFQPLSNIRLGAIEFHLALPISPSLRRYNFCIPKYAQPYGRQASTASTFQASLTSSFSFQVWLAACR